MGWWSGWPGGERSGKRRRERHGAILRPSIHGIGRSTKLLAAALPLRWIWGSGEVSGKARWAMGRPDRRGLWAAFIYT